MPQYKIHRLFPTPLFEHDIEPVSAKIRDYVYAIDYYRPYADNGWLSENMYLLDEPVMKPLKDKIMEVFEVFIRNEVMLPEQMTFRMTNSWAVKHNIGDWGQQHLHTNCVFSGVYYLDTNDLSGDISFHRPMMDTSLFPTTIRPAEYKQFNDFNAMDHEVKCTNNKVVIFPSTLMHSIGKNRSEWDRYSIAFNFFPTGTWGRDEHELIL